MPALLLQSLKYTFVQPTLLFKIFFKNIFSSNMSKLGQLSLFSDSWTPIAVVNVIRVQKYALLHSILSFSASLSHYFLDIFLPLSRVSMQLNINSIQRSSSEQDFVLEESFSYLIFECSEDHFYSFLAYGISAVFLHSCNRSLKNCNPFSDFMEFFLGGCGQLENASVCDLVPWET